MILHVVLYDPETGDIHGTYSGSKERIRALSYAFKPVKTHSAHYAVTHRVTNGRVTPKSAEEVTAQALGLAKRALIVHRDRLLSEAFEAIHPIRWNAMSPNQQAAWTAYVQALEAAPDAMPDPANPIWPTPPTV